LNDASCCPQAATQAGSHLKQSHTSTKQEHMKVFMTSMHHAAANITMRLHMPPTNHTRAPTHTNTNTPKHIHPFRPPLPSCRTPACTTAAVHNSSQHCPNQIGATNTL
jgi:hypothetical protein